MKFRIGRSLRLEVSALPWTRSRARVSVGRATTSDREFWFEATAKPLKLELMSGLRRAESGSCDAHRMSVGFLRLTLGIFSLEHGNSDFQDPTWHTFDDRPEL
jgi:hypothetical protein